MGGVVLDYGSLKIDIWGREVGFRVDKRRVGGSRLIRIRR